MNLFTFSSQTKLPSWQLKDNFLAAKGCSFPCTGCNFEPWFEYIKASHKETALANMILM